MKIKYLSISMMFAMFAFMGFAQVKNQDKTLPGFDQGRKLQYAEKIISAYYVDEIDEGKIVEEAIKAMLATLDPHSVYSDPEETKELTTPLEGNFSGIGIQFNMLNDTLRIIQTVPGGPSEKVGLLPGDRILVANDSIMSGAKRKNTAVMAILRGPKGTTVDVLVSRKGESQPIKFRIVRDDIPIESVDAAYMVSPKTGYISVVNFAERTPDELREAIRRLQKEGMENLILDLQDNGGGYMNSAVEMAGEFLSKGDLVVSTRAPRTNGEVRYEVENKGLMPDGRLVVLVNQYSASASEILSGAIQDHDRGLVVGRRTFGKGLVQRPMPFPDGSMIRLTVSRYYTPSGRTIQKPYTKGHQEDYTLDMINRYNSGELMSADSVHFADSLKTTTLKNKRIIYGGGGIMPDLFVPVDTTGFSIYYRDLVAKGIINKFVIEYVDQNRSKLKSLYPDSKTFVEKFNVDSAMINRLIAIAAKDSVIYNPEQYEISKKMIEAVTKGLIGRDLFDSGTYQMVTNPLNPIFTEAIGLIEDKQRYDAILTGNNRRKK